MKMILAIVDDTQSEWVSRALLDEDFRVTQLASTGGFLRGGSTTLMVGAEDELVEKALQIVRQQVPSSDDVDKPNATLFVLNVKGFKRV
jgi:uncharacterized protein YaaQ